MIVAFQRLLGPAKVSVLPADLSRFSRDESDIPGCPPRCVLTPACVEDVQGIVQTARHLGIPLTARGAGTSLEGSSIPSPGAAVVDFSRMTHILEFEPLERRVTVEPGVVYDALNRRLGPSGLFFPPSPGGSGDTATIGGMVSTDASGLYAVRYGGTRPWVLALDVVTGRGDVLTVGSAVPKSSSGYALKDLFIGAEGTLGLITSVTLRLAPLPEGRLRAAFAFSSLADAADAAAEIAGMVPEIAAVELVDDGTLRLLRRLPGNEAVPEGHVLFLEFHGRPVDLAAGAEAAGMSAAARGGKTLAAEGVDPWALRHRMTGTIRESAGPAGVVRTDCAVPLTRLADFVATTKRDAGPHRLHVFGHAGIGILHILMPLGGEGSWNRDDALAYKADLASRAVALGGTVSGEHGIGLGNRDVLAGALPGSVSLMRAIKTVFDPTGILNPGKIFDDRIPDGAARQA